MNTPTAGNPVIEDPKNKHLAKAKPPALDNRAPAAANVGSTDPSLRVYQDRRSSGGGAMKILLVIVLLLVTCVVLVLFVKPVREAVRPLFPAGIQRLLMDDEGPQATSATNADPVATPAVPAETEPVAVQPVAVQPTAPAVIPNPEVTTPVPAEVPVTPTPKVDTNGQ